MQICINSPQQRELPTGSSLIDSQRSTFTYWYANSSQVSLTDDFYQNHDSDYPVGGMDRLAESHDWT